MQRALAIFLVALATASGGGPTQTLAETHAYRLIKLPNGDYTLPKQALQGSQTMSVNLHPQGLRTIVTVYVFAGSTHKHMFSLHSGSDCTNAAATPLNAAMTGHASRTIVSVPIQNFSAKDYSISVRNASSQQQFREACIHI